MDGLFFVPEGIPLWLIGACGFLLLIQLYYILLVHGKLAFHKGAALEEPAAGESYPPISLIICVRNEEALLASNLASLLDQDYPDFEVIVVNDRSEDDTKWLLRDMEAQRPQLKVINIAEHVMSRSGKKFGIAIGIKAATHEHVVLTDVSCTPASDQWLKHLGRGLKEAKIVLGYVHLQRKKGFLNSLIRFEHFSRSMNYLSRALWKKPYSGLGQNLAYAKALFFEGKGFASHIHVRAGYDELFVNQHAEKRNTSIVIHPEAHVSMPLPDSARNYWIERSFRRQAVALFKPAHRRFLGLQAISAVLFYSALVASVIYQPLLWPWVLAIYLVRLLALYGIYVPLAKRFCVSGLLWYLPFIDLAYSFSLGLNPRAR